MILKRLKEFWEREGGLPSGYQPAFLTKRIVIDKDAKLLSVEPLSGETRGKREGKTLAVPREQPQRTVAIRSRLVQDNANYALGMAGPEDKPEKVAARHAAYVEQLRTCYEATHEATLDVLLRWFSSGGPQDPRIKEGVDPKADDLLFEVDGVVPTDLDSLKAFWARKEGLPMGRCLVTGEETTVVDRMPFAIKGIPNGQTVGTMLVSVNNPSGESYGLKAGLNSPIGSSAAEAICNGLNSLVANRKHSLIVGPVIYVYWTREVSEYDFFASFDQPKEGEVRALIESASVGGPMPDVHAPDFFVLALSANASRIVVRDFHETTLPAVQWALGWWFRSLDLVGTDGNPARPVGVRSLAGSLYRDRKDIPSHVPIEMLRSALTGTPLPLDLLALAVKRNIVMRGPFEEFNNQRRFSMGRLALIKAVLTSHSEDQEQDTLSALNPNHPSAAYHCGRLLAVLEAIQKQYHRLEGRTINRTVVDKFYGAASTTPRTTFGILVRDATRSHLPKIHNRYNSTTTYLDRALMEVQSQFDERFGYEYPPTLTYIDQGFFALGYYHQRADDLAAAIANKELKELAETTTTETETE